MLNVPKHYARVRAGKSTDAGEMTRKKTYEEWLRELGLFSLEKK